MIKETKMKAEHGTSFIFFHHRIMSLLTVNVLFPIFQDNKTVSKNYTHIAYLTFIDLFK